MRHTWNDNTAGEQVSASLSFSTGWIAVATLSLAGLSGLPQIAQAASTPFSSFPKLPVPSIAVPSRGLQLPSQSMRAIQKLGLEIRKADLQSSHGLSTQKFQLSRGGIEILGAMTLLHRNENGTVEIENDSSSSNFKLSTIPSLSAAEASSITLGILGDRDLHAAPELKILPSEQNDGSARLIYWVTVSPVANEAGRDFLIHAHSGALIADISHHLEIAPSEVLSADDSCQRIDEISGYPIALDPSACPTAYRSGTAYSAADESSERADKNGRDVLQYFWTQHGRDSFDDKGSTLTSVVHVGRAFANAFWSSDRNFMAYGDGDGVVMTDLTHSLDVAGHEMAHGVTSQTSKLIYQSESGALNEAFSDFFGVAVAARAKKTAPDWAIGKEIFLGSRREVGLRNLKDPASIMARTRDDEGNLVIKPYPAHVKDQFTTANACTSLNDRCFVHINSMIPGHAMYRMSEAIGLEKTEKLLYITLTQYLTKTSNFMSFKLKTMKACGALLPLRDCRKVRQAFNDVGL